MTSLSNAARQFFLVKPETQQPHDRTESVTMAVGAVDIIGFNLAPVKSRTDATVSSVSWESDNSAVSLASSSNTAISVQVTATAASPGSARLKATITLSDNQIIVKRVDVKVIKLDYDSDYPHR